MAVHAPRTSPLTTGASGAIIIIKASLYKLALIWSKTQMCDSAFTIPNPDDNSALPPDVLDNTGGEPLANSGFEVEDPEPDFDERS
jgi:hypothetical protein